MKTRNLLIIIFCLFSLVVTAQTKTWENSKIKIQVIPESAVIDSLLVPAPNGIVNHVKYSSLFAKLLADLPLGGGGVDWTLASQGIIHATNYVDNNTQLNQSEVGAFATSEGFIKTYIETDPTVDGTETKINAGSGVSVTGLGSVASPYVINSTGGGTGDMIKSVYDTNDDGVVDNSATLGGQIPNFYLDNTDTQNPLSDNIATTSSTVSASSTAVKLVNDKANANTSDILTKEDDLGNPSINGYVLSSQIDGTRSWVNNESVVSVDQSANYNWTGFHDFTTDLTLGSTSNLGKLLISASGVGNYHLISGALDGVEITHYDGTLMGNIVKSPGSGKDLTTVEYTTANYLPLNFYLDFVLKTEPFQNAIGANLLTEISLHTAGGSIYTTYSHNSAIFTISSAINAPVKGGWARWTVNSATEPIVTETDNVTQATKLESTFVANTDMFMIAYYEQTNVFYYFLNK